MLGVFALVIAHGAGPGMRQTLGTAAFAGMIGVTLFWILLTPLFYFVVRWLVERKAPAAGEPSQAHGVATPVPAVASHGQPGT